MITIEEVHREIVKNLDNISPENIVIAGGSVRDTLMGRTPKDFDIFLLNNSFIELKNKQEEEIFVNKIKDKLKFYSKVDIKLEWHKSEPFLIDSLRMGNDNQEVQIMASPYKNVDELLDSFDWNICLFAYDGKTFYGRENINNIATGEYLKLQKCTFPYSTLRRGYRFSERFKMRLKTEDIRFLCSEILKIKPSSEIQTSEN